MTVVGVSVLFAVIRMSDMLHTDCACKHHVFRIFTLELSYRSLDKLDASMVFATFPRSTSWRCWFGQTHTLCVAKHSHKYAAQLDTYLAGKVGPLGKRLVEGGHNLARLLLKPPQPQNAQGRPGVLREEGVG